MERARRREWVGRRDKVVVSGWEGQRDERVGRAGLTWATVTAICSSLCLSIMARCWSIILFGTAHMPKQ